MFECACVSGAAVERPFLNLYSVTKSYRSINILHNIEIIAYIIEVKDGREAYKI
jgi:hypothetical protein